ncbi:nucleotidyl transferase AbiEii/AbiGii toxin family protein [Oscillatoria sp. FACHB-1406]|uniref:nucleotidyl transferase AbiEii/AbiGii toxin family protein n=1 Tax=Oscillatoria sp. FACHB-1406 TaxID=2692846 RepID=UPI0016850685|nr:nucleotidyl transferase AbiEii/AbiGii toxin family protein [Oscillatoria sp. FACHB-1406]MBD2576684.1 nucleotidyl transferase AbiEii/AbiGii toxin family protein [Oscillatoria sp. FACHB-1406]
MVLTEQQLIELKAHEAFIRRASQVNFPFMLKGSYVTRQYFFDPNDRIPADLDWVYLHPLNDANTARDVLNEWVTAVTELESNDGVQYRSFKENEFWRRIDYAMADDFPTANTDLLCWVNGVEIEFSLDVSFNLEIEESPIPLIYEPLEGDAFIVPYTVPLSLQVSWKIHQTLVRPRFKDLFDLMYLVRHPDFDEKALTATLQALVNECHVDKVNKEKLEYFFNYKLAKLFVYKTIDETWEDWRNEKSWYSERAENITNADKIPKELSQFLAEFQAALEGAGLDKTVLAKLPKAARNKRVFFDGLLD